MILKSHTFLGFAFFLSNGVFAQNSELPIRDPIPPKNLSGDFFEHFGFSRGLFCDKESYLKGSWSTRLAKVEMGMDAIQDLQISVHLENTKLNLDFARQGGVRCELNHYKAQIELGKMLGVAKLISAGDRVPEVHFNSLQFEKLKISSTQLLITQKFSSYVEKSLNKWIGILLKGSLGKKIDTALSERLRKYLYRNEHPEPDSSDEPEFDPLAFDSGVESYSEIFGS